MEAQRSERKKGGAMRPNTIMDTAAMQILWIVILIVITLINLGITYGADKSALERIEAQASSHEIRLRQLEITIAEETARFEDIINRLERIENKIN